VAEELLMYLRVPLMSMLCFILQVRSGSRMLEHLSHRRRDPDVLWTALVAGGKLVVQPVEGGVAVPAVHEPPRGAVVFDVAAQIAETRLLRGFYDCFVPSMIEH
jgi:hypothetical protein